MSKKVTLELNLREADMVLKALNKMGRSALVDDVYYRLDVALRNARANRPEVRLGHIPLGKLP